MTKRHFIAIAETIAASDNFRSEKQREQFARNMARSLSAFNGMFDTERFIAAATGKPFRR